MELESLLTGLIPWLNQHLPLKPGKPVSAEDIAHIGLTAAEMAQLPGAAVYDDWHRTRIKHFAGFVLWETPYTMPPLTDCAGLRRRIAWKLTGNTTALFNR